MATKLQDWFAVVVAIGLPLAWALAYGAVLPSAQARPLAAYLPYFLGGCALGLWLPARPNVHPIFWWGLSAVAGAALLLAFPYLRRHFGAELPMWRDPLVFVTMVLVFVTAIWRAGAFAILAHPVAVWVGTISYGLYLWNPIAINLVGRMGGAGFLGTPTLMLALSLIFGALSWVLIERPALGWTRAQLPQDGNAA